MANGLWQTGIWQTDFGKLAYGKLENGETTSHLDKKACEPSNID